MVTIYCSGTLLEWKQIILRRFAIYIVPFVRLRRAKSTKNSTEKYYSATFLMKSRADISTVG